MNNLKNKYIEYLKTIIDFKKYEDKINSSGLLIQKSSSMNNNLSDYYSLLNNIYTYSLTKEEIEILNNENKLSNIEYEIIDKHKKQLITNLNTKAIMYNPPRPDHNVKSGKIVLEFVYGRNSKQVNDDIEYVQLIKKQKKYISQINEELKKEILEKTNIECEFFIEKRV